MGLLTKNIKRVSQYHQWSASEMSNGDILGVWESLGNREAHTVTVESLGGASTIRLNVSKKIYKEWGEADQWAGMGQGLPRPIPRLVTEIEEMKDDIVIEDASTQTWTADEIRVKDIKIVSKSTGLKITVT
jgi:hypothetical protein